MAVIACLISQRNFTGDIGCGKTAIIDLLFDNLSKLPFGVFLKKISCKSLKGKRRVILIRPCLENSITSVSLFRKTCSKTGENTGKYAERMRLP